MGNICGKQERDDSVPNSRPAGSAPPRTKASKSAFVGKGHTLDASGPGSSSGGGAGGSVPDGSVSATDAVRSKWTQPADKKKRKSGAARIPTAKENEERNKRWDEIDAAKKQAQAQID